MTGMDIIEALRDIDPDMILDAKKPVKHIPKWLKLTSLAACICCLIALVTLSLGHILDGSQETEGQFNPLASADESTKAQKDTLILTSDQFDVSLEIPASYNENVLIDTPLSSNIFADVYNESIAFSFYDGTSRTLDDGGFIWSIAVYPASEYDYGSIAEFNQSTHNLNKLLLGTKDNQVFELIYPDIIRQFDFNNSESTLNYFTCTLAGYEALSDFTTRNGLTENSAWSSDYSEHVLGALNTLIDTFFHETTDEKISITSNRSGTKLTIPASYQVYFEIDTPYIDEKYDEVNFENVVYSFYAPDCQTEYYKGLIWSIMIYDANSYENHNFIYDMFMYNMIELGSDKNYDYVLLYPEPEHQYDLYSQQSALSYFRCLLRGIIILHTFIEENQLNSDGTWQDVYFDKVYERVLSDYSKIKEITEFAISTE